MDRRTLFAIILSVVVITIGFSIQSILFPRADPAPQETEQAIDTPTTEPIVSSPESDGDTSTTTESTPTTSQVSAPTGAVVAVPEENIGTQTRIYRNNLIEVTMSPYGGSIDSFKLLDHLDGDEPVDMVFRGTEEQRAFLLHFGDFEDPAVDVLFHFDQFGANVFEFYRDFYVVGREDAPFRITKRFTFANNEYMFQLDVEIQNSVNEFIPLNFAETAYTVGFGPQLGPEFLKLDQRTEFRRYLTYDDGKRQNHKVSPGGPELISERVDWAALAGKYFAVIALTDSRELTAVLAQEPREGLPVGSQLYLERPVIRASSVEDSYQFYVGPKTPAILNRYNDPNQNAFGRGDLDLAKVQESRVLFGWLESILKWMLQMIGRVMPNWGISIIILTIIVKLALWPLTRKSYQSTARMQAVQPKINELRERLKDNQQKLNAEMAALYKKEGVNPLGGCLPMLAQFPFFIAMYGLFSNHFDLRGAVFIPGWISDLSAPDVIIGFGDFTIPLIGWTAIRGLPLIFLATQLISSKLMQTPSATQSNAQMKLMQLGMPVLFFFILYNVPSGLLVYWIFSNLLTSAQQYYYNKVKKDEAPPPPKKKPKR